MPVIQIPYNFTPREYQRPIFNLDLQKTKRAIAVWHRRGGKDKCFVNICAREALRRVGTYFYILPFYAQARKIIWEGIDKDGFRNIDHFPPEIIARKNNQEMVLELKNGSFVRFLGSDNIDSIVGTNPVGVIFSEFSLHKVAAWDYLRPILLENGGWAIFNGTPRGKNHLYHMVQQAKQDPTWFVSQLTIADTGVMTEAQVEQQIAEGMPRALALQEFYCSFEAAMTGAYYGEVMTRLDSEGRLTTVPYDPTYPVNTAWDLGISDMLTMWYFQRLKHGLISIIDCMAENGKGLEYYVKYLWNKPYVYGYHILPHDVRQRELASGKTRLESLMDLGLKNVVVAPKLSIEDGINATRNILSRCVIDSTRCFKGIEALKQYRADWDPDSQTYGKPVHDWSSHYSDAMRYLAVGFRDYDAAVRPNGRRLDQAVGTDYNPLKIDSLDYRRRYDQRATSGGDDGRWWR